MGAEQSQQRTTSPGRNLQWGDNRSEERNYRSALEVLKYGDRQLAPRRTAAMGGQLYRGDTDQDGVHMETTAFKHLLDSQGSMSFWSGVFFCFIVFCFVLLIRCFVFTLPPV